LAAYVLTGPGRIDIIDGQLRYDVTRSLLDGAGFQVRDPVLPHKVAGLEGRQYAFYGPGASVLGLPLVWLARSLGGDRNTEMFFFSLTSAFVVSACVGAFYLLRRRLGGTELRSTAWAFFLAFGTPLWPLATTVFDQGQHAAVLFLATTLGWEAALRQNRAIAVLAGVVGGSVVLFQEGLLLLLPFVGLCTLEGAHWPGRGRFDPWAWIRMPELRSRYLPFALGCAVPFALWLLFNFVRFGSPFDSGKADIAGHPPIWGSPVAGFFGLLFSPGKSIFLFFPSLLPSLLCIRAWWRKTPLLCLAVVATTVVQLAVASSLTFWGSDWAWGPRYLMLLAPLLTIPLGLFGFTQGFGKWILFALVPIAIGVQLMGILVDQHPFFFERNLSAYFWYYAPETYWHESQLFARPAEIARIFTQPFPLPPIAFRPGPYQEIWPTYCIFGGRPFESHLWMQRFAVFYLPRPWPLWIGFVPAWQKPVSSVLMLGASLSVGCAGLLGLGLGLRRRLAQNLGMS